MDDSGRIRARQVGGVPEVKKIAALLSLVEGPELRPEQFLQLVRGDINPSRESAAFDIEANLCRSEDVEPFAGVDLNLQLHRHGRYAFALNLVTERDPITFHFPCALPKPGVENAAHLIHDGAGRAGGNLHKVDILRIPRRGNKIQLVKRRPAPECEHVGHALPLEQFDESPADDQVLLHV
jgi:hypothetical protein